MKIAVLEVDVAQAGRMKAACEEAGHTCTLFHSSRALLQADPASHVHAIVMGRSDTGLLPHEMVMWLRRGVGISLPIALIGGTEDDAAVAAYYDAGADIYLRQPFSAGELGARLSALRRWVVPDPDEPFDLAHGPFRFATADRRVWVGGRHVQLAPKEFDLSVLLFRNLGELVLRETMLEQVWRRELHPKSRTIDSHLSRIRTKLALWPHNGVRLTAIYGLGSRLDPA